MKIRLLNSDPEFHEAFSRFTERHRLSFHAQEWVQNYPKEQLVQAIILNDNNEITGCFIYYTFKKATLNFVISPPFTPGIELFYINPATSVVGAQTYVKDLTGLIADHFRKVRASLMELHLPCDVVDTQPFTWKGFTVKTRYTYLIDLQLSQTELLNNLSSEKRKSLNKAAKDELEVSETTEFETVHQLILQSLARNKVDSNKEILRKILMQYALSGKCIAFLARRRGRPLAATFCVTDRERAVYLFGGFDNKNQHHGAGVACMWHSILEAKKRGLTIFDFEGSMNAGIERYFREFGGRLTPYYSLEKSTVVVNVIKKLLRK